VKIVVVGGGSWGTAFSRVLANREHDVTLACRDAEQARAIEETHRNPRYLTHCDLRGVAAALGRSEFEVARIVYGLLTTGIIELREPSPGVTGVDEFSRAGRVDPREQGETRRAKLIGARGARHGGQS